jgi:hypothetical protein
MLIKYQINYWKNMHNIDIICLKLFMFYFQENIFEHSKMEFLDTIEEFKLLIF